MNGFCVDAFAFNSDAITERIQRIAEKRIIEYEKEKAAMAYP